MQTFRDALDAAEPRPAVGEGQSDKKNYAQRLSEKVAWLVANGLRPHLAGEVFPTRDGKKQESKAASGRGPKKLDVNYSTQSLGLAMGVSVKTLNFRDKKSRRYTKNYTRVDNELRAEAKDYHQRQPYAYLAAVLYLPWDACDDCKKKNSSFAQAIDILGSRAGRSDPKNEQELFERLFVALYEHESSGRGDVSYFDVVQTAPIGGRPDESVLITHDEFLQEILDGFWRRTPSAKK